MYMPPFNVTYSDGRVVVASPKPADLVAFERQYQMAFTSIGETPNMEWLFYMAWAPLHRTKQEPRAFDEFLADVEDVDQIKAQEPAPFDQAVSDASLPEPPPSPA